jgi:hypothetical protein
MIPKRTLGQGLAVSAVGLGCMGMSQKPTELAFALACLRWLEPDAGLQRGYLRMPRTITYRRG